MRTYALLACITLNACGQAEQIDLTTATSGPATSERREEAPARPSPSPRVQTVGSPQAEPVALASELVPCTPEREGQLVLVRETRALMGCLEGAWEEVDLRGKDGAQGAQGERGEKGDRGDQGVAGADGRDGVDGKDGLDGVDGADAALQAGQRTVLTYVERPWDASTGALHSQTVTRAISWQPITGGWVLLTHWTQGLDLLGGRELHDVRIVRPDVETCLTSAVENRARMVCVTPATQAVRLLQAGVAEGPTTAYGWIELQAQDVRILTCGVPVVGVPYDPACKNR